MSWFRCVETRPWASLRLFCLPHAGGSAVFYRTWAREVGPAIELHAVQYPGRADRMSEPMVSDADRLARLIAGAMAPLLDRPFALFGHSMGAVVAYEVARLLQERGTPPVHLFASGARPPHDRGEDRVAGRDDDGLVEALAELGGTDAEVLQDPELRELVLPYVRNDFALIEGYRHRPEPRLNVPVTVLAGDSDPHADPGVAAKWRQVTDAGPCNVRVWPGGHFYLTEHRSEVIGEVLRTLEVPVGP
ncbi:thioesterase II family protein [Actinomadura viridis]|uniref:thioesterase II family protein n=1 Tax=Actinomadura viridis TaxID=58110 RepID=UPI003688BD00